MTPEITPQPETPEATPQIAQITPELRHDLISGLNTLYGILFADTQGWEPIPPSVREQLSLIAERLAAIIPDEDRILKKNWTVVAPAVCRMRGSKESEVA